MKSSKLRKLKAVEAGDVMFGIAGGGQRKLLLVTKATKASIFARHVPTQTKFTFGRDGRSKKLKGGHVAIVSVRPLAPNAYDVVLGLDRKMRLGQFPDGFMLTRDEVNMLLKIDDYFLARPLIDGGESMELPEGAKPAELDLTTKI